MADRIRSREVGPELQVEQRAVTRRQAGRATQTADGVAIEEPLEIRLAYGPDGQRAEASISITMRTPGADPELAVGFLFGEGLIARADDVRSADACGPSAPGRTFHNVVRVELASHVDLEPARLLRHFYTTSSCGVCGKASLDALRQQPRLTAADAAFRISNEALTALPAMLGARQETFARTGGLHGVGLFDAHGSIEAVYEDVGRHNALDKLVGAGLQTGTLPWSTRGVLLSGRASFELLQKAMMAGAPLVAAIGAPSSLAIDLAQEFGLTLVGFLRRDGFNVYSHPERVAA